MTVPSKSDLDKRKKALEQFNKHLDSEGRVTEKKLMYWTVISGNVYKENSKSPYVMCRCICGLEKLVYKPDLSRNKSNSCYHCSRVSDPQKFCEIREKYNLPRKLKEIPTYKIWWHIEQRCRNPSDASYPNYGGRGITLDPVWDDYLDFMDWSYSNGWEPKLTIERIDVNGNYSPDNCKWIPLGDQARNKRKYKNNKSGVTGIHNFELRWMCSWYEEGNQFKTKSFSKKKYGDEVAKNMAIEYRKLQMEVLRESGIEYGEFHGL